MHDVALKFDLHGAGWATITLRVGDATIAFAQVSYLSDPLRDFIAAALNVAEGMGDTVELYDEPGTWRIALCFDECSPWETDIDIQITAHAEFMNSEASAGDVLFHGACDADSFAQAVLAMADDVLTRIGAQEYANEWDFRSPFPFRGHAALKAALAIPRPVRDPRD